MSDERDDLTMPGPDADFHPSDEYLSNRNAGRSRESRSDDEHSRDGRPLKRVTFDDFQITRAQQEAQVEEERKAWREREERMEKEKPALFRFAVPRLKSLRDEMIGGQSKLPFFRKPHSEPVAHGPSEEPGTNGAYFAEHERAIVRVTKAHHEEEAGRQGAPARNVSTEPAPLIEVPEPIDSAIEETLEEALAADPAGYLGNILAQESFEANEVPNEEIQECDDVEDAILEEEILEGV